MAKKVVMKRTICIGGFILVSLVGKSEVRSLEEPALDAMGIAPVVRTTNVTTTRLSSLSQDLEKAVLEQKTKTDFTKVSKHSFWRN